MRRDVRWAGRLLTIVVLVLVVAILAFAFLGPRLVGAVPCC